MKTLIGIIVVILIGFGAWSMLKEPNTGEPATGDEVMTGETVALEDGGYAVNPEESSIGWSGSKPLLTGYFDQGTINVQEGSFVVAGGKIVSGSFTIDINSINTTQTSNTKVEASKLSTHFYER